MLVKPAGLPATGYQVLSTIPTRSAGPVNLDALRLAGYEGVVIRLPHTL